MSFKTAQRAAEVALRRWNRSNTATTQQRLIADNERLWRLGRDLSYALDELLAHSRGHSSKCSTPNLADPASEDQ